MLKGGPYFIGKRPIIMRQWSLEFNMTNEIMRNVPIWVKLPNLPLYCWGIECLSRIASALGVPLLANENTLNQRRITYARILVEMDVTKATPKEIKIQDINGNIFDQKVVYSWYLLFVTLVRK